MLINFTPEVTNNLAFGFAAEDIKFHHNFINYHYFVIFKFIMKVIHLTYNSDSSALYFMEMCPSLNTTKQ
jgi:hypothetical protein